MKNRENIKRRLCRDTKGQVIVEFALLFPIQLFLILAILEIALIQVGRIMVGYAAYCAAHAEVMGGDPSEAAAIALIPLCDEDAGTRYSEIEPGVEGDAMEPGSALTFPGWGYIGKWENARNRTAVYRLKDDSSEVLNRSTIYQEIYEQYRTHSVRQHNIGVEVRFLYRLRLPLSILSILYPTEELDDFNDWHDSVVVMWDDKPHIVLRERHILPNRRKIIRSDLPVKDIEGEYREEEPLEEVAPDIRDARP